MQAEQEQIVKARPADAQHKGLTMKEIKQMEYLYKVPPHLFFSILLIIFQILLDYLTPNFIHIFSVWLYNLFIYFCKEDCVQWHKLLWLTNWCVSVFLATPTPKCIYGFFSVQVIDETLRKTSLAFTLSRETKVDVNLNGLLICISNS